MYCEGCGSDSDGAFCEECLPSQVAYVGSRPPEEIVLVTPRVVAVYKKVRRPTREEIERN